MRVLSNNEIKRAGETVLKYLKKHNCVIKMRWNYGIAVHKVVKQEKELSYPRITEEIWCSIADKLKVISGEYQKGPTYSLK